MEAIEEQVLQMCNLQKHGGPDDAGIYHCAEANLILGHRRLALIDLSVAGHQPMSYQNRYIISFNGEIYNFRELKKELSLLGDVFNTHSDTEVIMAAFMQWNTQSFGRLRGMFAFALFDVKENELYLVRDPSGIKPLYYSVNNTTIQFASEIRAFQATGIQVENKDWPVFQLAYGHIPEPVTTLKEVKPLHKGCFYKYNLLTGANSLQSFRHYSYSDRLHNKEIALEAIKTAIEKAVQKELLSDAPLGVFLSGGIDSGIITLLAAAHQREHLKTLSLYFKEVNFSEKLYQDSIIKKLQCKSYQHLLTEPEFHSSFPNILKAMDMPSCDGVNTWFISKYARQQGLKAVLSGIGGDELFGGYPSFNRMAIACLVQKMPDAALKFAGLENLKKLSRLTYLSIEGIKGLFLFLRGQFIPQQIAQQLGGTEKEIWDILRSTPCVPALNNLPPKNEASWMELNMYLQNQLLRDADVMSMCHGIEIRVPFLDDEVIRTALSISPSIKYEGKLPKQLLINSLKDCLPKEVWNRKKMGFAFPFTKWLDNSTFVSDIMQSSNAAGKLNYKKFKEGKLHWSHLMSLIILQTRGALN